MDTLLETTTELDAGVLDAGVFDAHGVTIGVRVGVGVLETVGVAEDGEADSIIEDSGDGGGLDSPSTLTTEYGGGLLRMILSLSCFGTARETPRAGREIRRTADGRCMAESRLNGTQLFER